MRSTDSKSLGKMPNFISPAPKHIPDDKFSNTLCQTRLPNNFKRQQKLNEPVLYPGHCTRDEQDSHNFRLYGANDVVKKVGVKIIIKGNEFNLMKTITHTQRRIRCQ